MRVDRWYSGGKWLAVSHAAYKRKERETQIKAKKHMEKSSCLKSKCQHVSMHLAYVPCKCRCMQSVLNVFRNNEGTHYRHGNFAGTSKQVAVPAATSHPVVICWKWPALLSLTAPNTCQGSYLAVRYESQRILMKNIRVCRHYMNFIKINVIYVLSIISLSLIFLIHKHQSGRV